MHRGPGVSPDRKHAPLDSGTGAMPKKKTKKKTKKVTPRTATPRAARTKKSKKKVTEKTRARKKVRTAGKKKAPARKARKTTSRGTATTKKGTKKITKKTAKKTTKTAKNATQQASRSKVTRKASKKPAKKKANKYTDRHPPGASLAPIAAIQSHIIPASTKTLAGLDEPDTVRLKKLSPNRKKMNSRQLARIRALLKKKQRQISDHMQTELSELEAPERSHSGDLEEIASDTDGAESLCEIMDIEASQIGQIQTALKKIEEGTYGVCEDCGGDIAKARIEALPFASQCIECKRKAETAGETPSPYSSRMF